MEKRSSGAWSTSSTYKNNSPKSRLRIPIISTAGASNCTYKPLTTLIPAREWRSRKERYGYSERVKHVIPGMCHVKHVNTEECGEIRMCPLHSSCHLSFIVPLLPSLLSLSLWVEWGKKGHFQSVWCQWQRTTGKKLKKESTALGSRGVAKFRMSVYLQSHVSKT